MDALADAFSAIDGIRSDPPTRAQFSERFSAAQAAHPGVELAVPAFLGAWYAHIEAPVELGAALAQLHFEDFFLATACAQGDAAALALFEQKFLGCIETYLGRRGARPAFVDEVRQRVRLRLFVSEAGAQPKIASYSGIGPLAAWMRMVALRCAHDLERATKAHSPLEHAPPVPSGATDPELDYLKSHYSQAFETALASILGNLEPKERDLLRLYFLEGLTVERIGAALGVHKSTVTRWLAMTRDRVLVKTRAALKQRLGMSETELDSIWGLVESRVDVSVSRILKT